VPGRIIRKNPRFRNAGAAWRLSLFARTRSTFLNHISASSNLLDRGRNRSDSVLLFVGGLAVAVNVAVLWLTLRMARRASWEFDNTR
jgi:hypothetical protein